MNNQQQLGKERRKHVSILQDVIELLNLENASSNLDETTEFQDFIDATNRVADSVVNYKEIEENDDETMDSTIITNPRNQEIATSQKYEDKSLLKNVMSFYAIKTTSNTLFTSLTKWNMCEVSRSKMSSVFSSFKIWNNRLVCCKKILYIQIYSIDAIFGDHQQATSNV